MGPQLAWLCILIIDRKATSGSPSISNPGGYLRGMAKAHVNIVGSLKGPQERELAEVIHV
jgi:hypothetical protein